MTIQEIAKELNVCEDAARKYITRGIQRNKINRRLLAHKEIWRGCQMRWVITEESFNSFKEFYYR